MSVARIQLEPHLDPANRAADPVRSLANARVAIVHYWFVSHRGGERVVESIASMFPQADLFSLVVDPETLPDSLRRRRMQTSFLQNIPGSRRWHRYLLPVYPLALEQFDLSGYDLVISSESGPAKGVLTSAHTCHVCYCHSPMRYLWDFYHRYQRAKGFGLLTRPAFTLASHYLRLWDVASSGRVDYFIANSHHVAARIRKHYRRDAAVVHPPVNIQAGYLADRPSDYYLVVGQLVDYKRVDLAITASNRLGRRLHVVGAGEQYSRLKKLAGPTIHFCGALSDEELHKQYAHCRALLFPAEEDFGIVPVEALSFGRPVIAFGRGGARETINGFEADAPNPSVETSSGIFFSEQSSQSLTDAMLAFESVEDRFSPFFIRQQSERFAPARFQKEFGHRLAEGWAEFHHGPNSAAGSGAPSL
jgi:glycosyltransferase involved in cell wall biosynthesis